MLLFLILSIKVDNIHWLVVILRILKLYLLLSDFVLNFFIATRHIS